MTAIINNLRNRSIRVIAFGVLIFAMFITFIFASVIVKAQGKNTTSTDKVYYTNITVRDGETLWSIAEDNINYDHYDTVSEYVKELKRVNGMETDYIMAGKHLVVLYYR